jgi:hypothetical protein
MNLFGDHNPYGPAPQRQGGPYTPATPATPATANRRAAPPAARAPTQAAPARPYRPQPARALPSFNRPAAPEGRAIVAARPQFRAPAFHTLPATVATPAPSSDPYAAAPYQGGSFGYGGPAYVPPAYAPATRAQEPDDDFVWRDDVETAPEDEPIDAEEISAAIDAPTPSDEEWQAQQDALAPEALEGLNEPLLPLIPRAPVMHTRSAVSVDIPDMVWLGALGIIGGLAALKVWKSSQ